MQDVALVLKYEIELKNTCLLINSIDEIGSHAQRMKISNLNISIMLS